MKAMEYRMIVQLTSSRFEAFLRVSARFEVGAEMFDMDDELAGREGGMGDEDLSGKGV